MFLLETLWWSNQFYLETCSGRLRIRWHKSKWKGLYIYILVDYWKWTLWVLHCACVWLCVWWVGGGGEEWWGWVHQAIQFQAIQFLQHSTLSPAARIIKCRQQSFHSTHRSVQQPGPSNADNRVSTVLTAPSSSLDHQMQTTEFPQYSPLRPAAWTIKCRQQSFHSTHRSVQQPGPSNADNRVSTVLTAPSSSLDHQMQTTEFPQYSPLSPAAWTIKCRHSSTVQSLWTVTCTAWLSGCGCGLNLKASTICWTDKTVSHLLPCTCRTYNHPNKLPF